MQARHLYAQLAPVARCGQCNVAQVKFHIEIRVLHPVGPVQSGGHLDDPGAKQWQFSEPPLEAGNHVLEAHEAAGGCRWIVDSQPAHVLGRVGLLKIDKGRVKYSQLFHILLSRILRVRLVRNGPAHPGLKVPLQWAGLNCQLPCGITASMSCRIIFDSKGRTRYIILPWASARKCGQ